MEDQRTWIRCGFCGTELAVHFVRTSLNIDTEALFSFSITPDLDRWLEHVRQEHAAEVFHAAEEDA